MKFIYGTTKGYRGRFFLLFLTIQLGTLTSALFPFFIGKIVDQIFYQRQMKGFLVYFFLYAGMYFLNQCSHGALNYLWAHLKASYVVDIRKRCFRHLMRLKASVWTKMRSGDVMKRILDDTECFLEFIHRSLFYILANFLQLLFSVGYILFTNLYLGLATLLLTPVLAWSIRYFGAKLKESHQKIQTRKGLLAAWVLEMMAGISQWKLLNAQEKVEQDYREKTKAVIDDEMKAGYQELAAETANGALTLLGQLCVYSIAAFFICGGSMTMGQFVACASYFSTCSSYFNALGRKLTDVNVNLTGISRVRDFLAWAVERDAPGAADRRITEGNIRFREVSFGYGEGGEDVLRKLSLRVEPGEKVALVGRSGEGKSTLLSLLIRLYEPREGQIYIDDIPLSGYTLESLRSQIAVVQQESVLFHGSLRKNICLSDDTGTDDRILEILEGLRLTKLLDELPEGLDTIVGGGGREISGGQKQRVAIARCIFRQPRILLLDEATSALDEETERAVNAFIFRQLPDTAILLSAHRFATVLSADRAVVVEQGRVTAEGDHESLLRGSALYRTLYETAASG